MAQNALNWFEIPVANMERALKFYNAIFDGSMEAMPIMGNQMAFLPAGKGGVGGAIVQGDQYTPSTEGTVVYLSGGDDLSVVLNKVEGAGGKVLVPKTDIGENGFSALFVDSEGNRVGLHSME